MIIKGLVASTFAFLGAYFAILTFRYTKWTQGNDFRDGCINDRDHDLPMAVGCVAELARPRVANVNMKRHIEAVRHACLETPLYWTVNIFAPVLTCVFYLVWMRGFVRDGPRPVVSLAKESSSNCGQGHAESENAMATEIPDYLFDLSDVRDHKGHDHLQQSQMDSPLSGSGPDEDYFQVWKARMKRPLPGSEAADLDAGSAVSFSSSFKRALETHQLAGSPEGFWGDESDGLVPPDSRRGSVYTLFDDAGLEDIWTNPYTSEPLTAHSPPAEETLQSVSFELKFMPSGQRVDCQHVKLDVPASQFDPTDGIKIDLRRSPDGFHVMSVLKAPLERGAAAFEFRQWKGTGPIALVKVPKKAMWARRLGLASHRFVYVVFGDLATRERSSFHFSPEVSVAGIQLEFGGASANWKRG